MKTEKEKMISANKYYSSDDELVAERIKCKNLCHEYNALLPSETIRRKDIIKRIAKTNGDFLIEQPFMCDYGYNIEFGNNFYANHGLIILDSARVKFGNNVFIGPNCGFYTAFHPIDVKERNQGIEQAAPVTVGDNVWFGGNVVVLPGVTVGSNSTIGAGSVVVNDIPPYTLAFGNPCKPVRKI